eukprot:CAMPEP_0178414966 /NCGR_PEP_ID=MMETSP0689_2-20121128/23309_1 /TAXON_ID=160604 /ORGANISM="Amphidinium massartii, Strain CS-259" /LENGTH=579 /DNA_ID=CAMNT_0020036273 /DNA_START=138 /DNA_END=1874 /DNA_ORIENTATION=+
MLVQPQVNIPIPSHSHPPVPAAPLPCAGWNQCAATHRSIGSPPVPPASASHTSIIIRQPPGKAAGWPRIEVIIPPSEDMRRIDRSPPPRSQPSQSSFRITGPSMPCPATAPASVSLRPPCPAPPPAPAPAPAPALAAPAPPAAGPGVALHNLGLARLRQELAQRPTKGSIGALGQFAASLDLMEHDLDEIGQLRTPRSQSGSTPRATIGPSKTGIRSPRTHLSWAVPAPIVPAMPPAAVPPHSTVPIEGPPTREPIVFVGPQAACPEPPTGLAAGGPDTSQPAVPSAGHEHTERFRQAALAHMQRIESDLYKLRQTFGLPCGGLAIESSRQVADPMGEQSVRPDQPPQPPPYPPLPPQPQCGLAPTPAAGCQVPSMMCPEPLACPVPLQPVVLLAPHRQELSPAMSSISSVLEQDRTELVAHRCQQATAACELAAVEATAAAEVGSRGAGLSGGDAQEWQDAEADSKDRVMQKVFGSPRACADMSMQVQALNSTIAALKRDAEEKERRWAQERADLVRRLEEVQGQQQELRGASAVNNGLERAPQVEQRCRPRWDWPAPLEPVVGHRHQGVAATPAEVG